MLTTSINFFRSIRDTLFEPIACKVINKYGKGAVFQISTVFGPITRLLVERSSETGFLNNYLTTFFGVHYFQNTSAIMVIFYLKMFKF